MKIQQLGIQNYNDVWLRMKEFTQTRGSQTQDELWLLEHFPVYTQGQAGKPEHILNPSSIPIVNSDRGGQVTYHGPGQLVAYVLMDIKRRKLGIRTLVSTLEHIVISVLNQYDIVGSTLCGAPGVYVKEQKIASIGLRVKNGCSYHGVALNVDMDLDPFLGINPCGFSEIKMTQISHFYPSVLLDKVNQLFVSCFLQQFSP